MKIFHIIVGLGVGGAETMLTRLVHATPCFNHTIVSLTTLGKLGNDLLASGYRVYSLDLTRTDFVKPIFNLWRLIRENRPDVIQTWMYHSDLLGGLVGKLAGVSNIFWNVRCTEIPQRRFSLTGFVVRVCAMLSNIIPKGIICCANAAMKSHAEIGYNKNKLIFIPNGYDIFDLQPLTYDKFQVRSRYGLPPNFFVVGIVGRFDPLKGYDIFIEAAGIVSASTQDNLIFVMIGRNVDNQNAELRTLILNKACNAEFRLMGERNDTSQIMHALDVLCLASKAEGFPNVVAEAMLMEVPCVVSDVGDAAIIVGQTGKVVPPCNPNALAQAIIDIQGMAASSRLAMGRAARIRIVENFGIDVVAKRYSDVYELGIKR